MGFSLFWFVIFAIWIFILQSRVKDLEKKLQSIPKYQTNNIIEEEAEVVEDKSEQNIPEDIPLEITTNVNTFQEKYSEPEFQEPSKLLAWISSYFTQGNLLVRIGGIVLFFGLAFLLKYAAEHGFISIEVRLVSVAVAGIILITIGWKLRSREGAYGQILQGLGVAMLYLVIYASAKFYTILSLETAFGLMLIVVILGSVLAVIQNALPLALFSTSGGFMVPILTSTGYGSHIVLFSYYALLNLGLFLVAWYRSWRILNVLGFVSTFVIATIWGVLRYSPEFFATTEPFLILYFLMYLSISILFTMKQPFEPKNFVDGTLVFGLPLVSFPLQVSLVKGYAYGEAYSAAVLATLYTILYFWLKNRERTGLLSQSFLALGVIFYTIAIPYTFDADVSAALWSLEASAIIWLSLKQSRRYTRYFGEILLFISLALYPIVSANGITFAEYLGYIIVISAALTASYFLDKHQQQLSVLEKPIPFLLLLIAIIQWFVSTPTQLERYVIFYDHAMIFTLIIGTLLLFGIAKMKQWEMLVDVMQLYFFLGVILFANKYFYDLASSTLIHPFESYGAVAIVLFILVNYLLLYIYDKVWNVAKMIHISSLWFITAVLIWEFRYHLITMNMTEAVVMIVTAFVPLTLIFALLHFKKYPGWLERYRSDYQIISAGGLIIVLVIWELKGFQIASDVGLLYGIPVVNPLDLTQLLVLVMIGYWIKTSETLFSKESQKIFYGSLSVLGMVLASVIFARSVHLYRDVPYHLSALWNDLYFQAGLSILWSIIAIVLMLLSKHYQNRTLWSGGFGLLVLVVLKLFFIELANSDTVERIISFIVVGSLLLLIGYFVPLPPVEKNESSSNSE